MSTVKERFPYMFAGDNIGLSMAHGWEPLFETLCVDIDALLGDDKRKFHWTQLKEKFGCARFHWSMDNARIASDLISPERLEVAKTSATTLREKIALLVGEAQAQAQHMCIVCGQPGKVDPADNYMLVLCDEHIRQRAANKLPKFWSEDFK